MYTKRIIPCLDVKDGRVVKGTNFVGLRDAGDPIELSAVYDKEIADELVLLDITASHEERNTMVVFVSACASEVFIPFTVGGGIRTVEDIRKMLKAGADKVSLNTAAIKNPDLIAEGAKRFGSQCIVLAVDARSDHNGGWEVYINGAVGERFCVRNSGAIAVVEGTGDHCCEYMTGGRTVVLGTTGRNFAAGMSGGVAYVWNKNGDFDYFCNMEMVELSLIENAEDNKELVGCIAKHYDYTKSPLAKEMLDNWDIYQQQFIKVSTSR